MLNAFVYVIESPAPQDLLDGRTEGRSLCEVLRLADIPHWYSLVTTPETFQSSLTTRLVDAASTLKKSPILHLSMHGDGLGVQLTNGDMLTWDQLRKAIDPVTNALNGGLLVCMSSCEGASGCRMAMHQEPDHPFWALVGSSQQVLWADAAVAYITFYHSFFKGASLEESVNRMRIASGDTSFLHFSGAQIKADWAAYSQKTYQDALVRALSEYSGRNTPSSGGLLGSVA